MRLSALFNVTMPVKPIGALSPVVIIVPPIVAVPVCENPPTASTLIGVGVVRAPVRVIAPLAVVKEPAKLMVGAVMEMAPAEVIPAEIVVVSVPAR